MVGVATTTMTGWPRRGGGLPPRYGLASTEAFTRINVRVAASVVRVRLGVIVITASPRPPHHAEHQCRDHDRLSQIQPQRHPGYPQSGNWQLL